MCRDYRLEERNNVAFCQRNFLGHPNLDALSLHIHYSEQRYDQLTVDERLSHVGCGHTADM